MSKILLVDDEKDFLYPMGEMLVNRGYTVFTASSYKEALGVLSNYKVDIVVSDIILPGLDGFELIMYLNDNYPKIKIIAISGGGRVDKSSYLQLAEGLEVAATLAKPFLADDLDTVIKSIL